MIHAGDRMLAQGWCVVPGPPLPEALDGVPTQAGELVRVFLSSNHGEDPRERIPGPGAKVVVSFYVRATV
jgi:hypothetical protein